MASAVIGSASRSVDIWENGGFDGDALGCSMPAS
jgi:hypothetical protein